MEALASALEGLALAEWLRFSRWAYAAVNAAHILGIALLIGAVTTLDLRLMGLWRTVSLTDLYRVLSSIAAAGFGVAIITGFVLFTVRASEYSELILFFTKLGLIATALFFAVLIHFRYQLVNLSKKQQRLIGILSLSIWIAIVLCGRLIAFV